MSLIRQKANLKRRVTRKQSTPNFLKNEHFLPPECVMSVFDHFVGLARKGLNLTLAFSDLSQRLKMEPFPEIVNGSFLLKAPS